MAGNTAWVMSDRVVRMGVGLVVTVWIARYLGPGNFGALNFAIAFVALFSAVASFGLDGIVVRELVRRPAERNVILGTAFALRVGGGLVAVAASVAGIHILKAGDAVMIALVTISSWGLLFQAFDVTDFWFQSQVQSRCVVIARMFAFALATAVRVALVLGGAPLTTFAWVATAELGVAAFALAVVYRYSGGRLREWQVSRTEALLLVRDSLPMILSGVVTMIYMRLDQVMLGEMINSREVGVYSAAVRVAEASYFIPVAIVGSVFPSVVAARERGEDVFRQKLQRLYNLMAFIAYVVAVPTTLLAPLAIDLLYGDSYAGAAPLLALLAWTGLFVNLGVARGSYLMTMNWTRIYFVTTGLGALLNVGLNFLLIPRYGAMGAVIASLIAYWFAAHGSCYFYRPLQDTARMLARAMLYPRIW